MKLLLLDENISRRIVAALQDRFPGSSQVALLGLERASDAQLCDWLPLAEHECLRRTDFVHPRSRSPPGRGACANRSDCASLRTFLRRLPMGDATRLASQTDPMHRGVGYSVPGLVVVQRRRGRRRANHATRWPIERQADGSLQGEDAVQGQAGIRRAAIRLPRAGAVTQARGRVCDAECCGLRPLITVPLYSNRVDQQQPISCIPYGADTSPGYAQRGCFYMDPRHIREERCIA